MITEDSEINMPSAGVSDGHSSMNRKISQMKLREIELEASRLKHSQFKGRHNF